MCTLVAYGEKYKNYPVLMHLGLMQNDTVHIKEFTVSFYILALLKYKN